MAFNMFNRKERELAIDKAFFEAEQAEIERAQKAEQEAAAKAPVAQAQEVAEADPISTPEDLTFNTDPSLQNENYNGDEVAEQVRASAEKEAEDSLGGKPSAESQIASAREATPEKGPQPIYTPEGPRSTFGGHSEEKSKAGERAQASSGGGLGPRRGRQIKQGIGRIWYGLTGQDEKQAGIIASQRSADLRGQAVKSGLVTPDEVRDEVTADTLLANAIQYLDPSIPAHKRGVPMSPTEAKRKEDLARRIITQARNRSESALGDAWKHVPEDLREGAHKALGLEYDAASPAERGDVDPDTEGIQEPSRLVAARKAREAREAEGFNPDDFTFNTDESLQGSEPTMAVDPVKLSADVADSIIHIESRGKADAKNPHSSATGLYQFIDSTWLDSLDKYRPDLKEGRSYQEILDLRLDPEISREIGLRFTEGNIRGMQKAGISVTRGKVYLAHFLGLSGAKKLLVADPNARVDTVMSRAAMKANGSLLVKNGEPITIQQFIDWAEKKMA